MSARGISGDKKRVEALGVVGVPDSDFALDQETPPLTNGFSHSDPDAARYPTNTDLSRNGKNQQDRPKPIAHGVVNDI
jgi:hypothetical protein